MTVTAGQLLRETLRALRARLGAVLAAVFLCTLPATAVRSLTPWLMREQYAAIRPDKVIFNLEKLMPVFETALSVLAVAVAVVVLFLVLLAVAQAAIAPMVVGALSGRVVTLAEGLSALAARAPTFIALALAQTLLIVVASAPCFIPTFFVTAGLLVAVPAAVTERLGVAEALGRSWNMTKGFRTPILKALSVILLLTYVATTATSLTATLTMATPPSLASLILAEAVGSFVMIALGALYAALAGVAYEVIRKARAETESQAVI